MPSLIDTHSHIYVNRFASDIDEVIERARQAEVETIVVPVTNPTEHAGAFALAERYPEVKVALGVHPHHAHEVSDADLDEIEKLAAAGRGIAIGEIGLDYYYEFAPKERQHEVFRRQLQIAKRLGLPAAVHNRESDDDLLGIIEEEQDGSLRFQLHCFSSDKEVLARALELGAMISFTGNITYPKSTLDEVVRAVPDDRFMIETDAPYLTPVPYRGKRNEPSYVSLVAAKIAELRGESIDAIKQMTTTNARRFFKLPAAIIIVLLSLCGLPTGGSLMAQTSPAPVRPVDTVQKPMLYKLIGIGAHLGSSSYISGSTTVRSSVLGAGFWLTATPLQHLGVDWLQLDFIYTSGSDEKSPADSIYRARTGNNFNPVNYHTTIDIAPRFVLNARNVFSFYGSFGVTYFRNEWGIDQWYIEEDNDTILTDFVETGWGISGSIGVSININTPIGLVSPTGEWRVAAITGTRELPQRQQEFFVSQPRFGLIYYPNLKELLD